MHVRVTIARTVEEYADIDVPDVASQDEAVTRITAMLADSSATRARLLNKIAWMRGETGSEIAIVESAAKD